jgi:hypothetical protein
MSTSTTKGIHEINNINDFTNFIQDALTTRVNSIIANNDADEHIKLIITNQWNKSDTSPTPSSFNNYLNYIKSLYKKKDFTYDDNGVDTTIDNESENYFKFVIGVNEKMIESAGKLRDFYSSLIGYNKLDLYNSLNGEKYDFKLTVGDTSYIEEKDKSSLEIIIGLLTRIITELEKCNIIAYKNINIVNANSSTKPKPLVLSEIQAKVSSCVSTEELLDAAAQKAADDAAAAKLKAAADADAAQKAAAQNAAAAELKDATDAKKATDKSFKSLKDVLIVIYTGIYKSRNGTKKNYSDYTIFYDLITNFLDSINKTDVTSNTTKYFLSTSANTVSQNVSKFINDMNNIIGINEDIDKEKNIDLIYNYIKNYLNYLINNNSVSINNINNEYFDGIETSDNGKPIKLNSIGDTILNNDIDKRNYYEIFADIFYLAFKKFVIEINVIKLSIDKIQRDPDLAKICNKLNEYNTELNDLNDVIIKRVTDRNTTTSTGGSHQRKHPTKKITKKSKKTPKKTPKKKSTKTQKKASRRTTVKRNKGPKVALKKNAKKSKRIYVINEQDVINTRDMESKNL